MVNAAGRVARLTHLQVQEQAAGSSGDPPVYEGRIVLDPTLLDVERLASALETGGFELSNSWFIRTWSFITSVAPCSCHELAFFTFFSPYFS